MLFDLPLDAPEPAARRARRPAAAAPIQVDLFTAVAEEEIEEDVERDENELERAAPEIAAAPEIDVDRAPGTPGGLVVAGLAARLFAGCADAVLHLGVLGGAYLGVLALDVEPSLSDWPAFAILLVAFSFLSSVVSLAFWGQTAGMAWRGLQTRDRLQRPLTFRQAALRWTGGLLTFVTAGLPLLLTLGGASLGDWLSRSVTYSMGGAPDRLT